MADSRGADQCGEINHNQIMMTTTTDVMENDTTSIEDIPIEIIVYMTMHINDPHDIMRFAMANKSMFTLLLNGKTASYVWADVMKRHGMYIGIDYDNSRIGAKQQGESIIPNDTIALKYCREFLAVNNCMTRKYILWTNDSADCFMFTGLDNQNHQQQKDATMNNMTGESCQIQEMDNNSRIKCHASNVDWIVNASLIKSAFIKSINKHQESHRKTESRPKRNMRRCMKSARIESVPIFMDMAYHSSAYAHNSDEENDKIPGWDRIYDSRHHCSVPKEGIHTVHHHHSVYIEQQTKNFMNQMKLSVVNGTARPIITVGPIPFMYRHSDVLEFIFKMIVDTILRDDINRKLVRTCTNQYPLIASAFIACDIIQRRMSIPIMYRFSASKGFDIESDFNLIPKNNTKTCNDKNISSQRNRFMAYSYHISLAQRHGQIMRSLPVSYNNSFMNINPRDTRFIIDLVNISRSISKNSDNYRGYFGLEDIESSNYTTNLIDDTFNTYQLNRLIKSSIYYNDINHVDDAELYNGRNKNITIDDNNNDGDDGMINRIRDEICYPRRKRSYDFMTNSLHCTQLKIKKPKTKRTKQSDGSSRRNSSNFMNQKTKNGDRNMNKHNRYSNSYIRTRSCMDTGLTKHFM